MSVLQKTIDYVKTLNKKIKEETRAFQIRDFILNQNIADAYKASLISNIKKHLKSINYFKNIDTYNSLNAPTEIYDAVIKNAEKRRTEKIQLSLDIDTLQKLLDLKNTDDIYKLFTWLLFTSGLRLNEVFDNEITFVCVDKIKVKYISKKDNDPDNNPVYLLVPANEWIDIFNKFQKIKIEKNLTNLDTYHTAVKRVLNRLDINDKLSAHSLRKLYLTYQTEIRNVEPDKLPAIRTKKLLNHQKESTSVFYTGAIKITGDLRDVIKNNDKYNKMKVADIKKLLDECGIKYNSKMKKLDLINLIPV
jgi:site-specific recombinase XerC